MTGGIEFSEKDLTELKEDKKHSDNSSRPLKTFRRKARTIFPKQYFFRKKTEWKVFITPRQFFHRALLAKNSAILQRTPVSVTFGHRKKSCRWYWKVKHVICNLELTIKLDCGSKGA